MKKRLFVMWIAIALLVATWAYPPWVHSSSSVSYQPSYRYRWAFIFDVNQGEYYARELEFKIDYERLLILDGIIIMIAAGFIISFRKSG